MTYTQVNFVLCKVYWIICAEETCDCILPFIIITLNLKTIRFLRSSTNILSSVIFD